jgi:hypothetical protein
MEHHAEHRPASRIRREIGVHAKAIRSVADLAQIGADAVKQLRRLDTACTVLHKIQPAGFLKTIFTSGLMLLRILPDLNAQRRSQQNDVDAVNTEQDHFKPYN